MCLLCTNLDSLLTYPRLVIMAKLYRVLTGRSVLPTKREIHELLPKTKNSVKIILLVPLYSAVDYDICFNFLDNLDNKLLKLLRIRDKELYNYVLYHIKLLRRHQQCR